MGRLIFYVLGIDEIRDEIYSPFGWRGEGRGVEGSRVVLAKNKLILG